MAAAGSYGGHFKFPVDRLPHETISHA